MIKPGLRTQVFDALNEISPVAARLFDRKFSHPKRDHEPSSSLIINDLNQFWRIQLGSLSIDTISARSVLIDTDNQEEWLSLFKQYVLPVAVTSWADASCGGSNA